MAGSAPPSEWYSCSNGQCTGQRERQHTMATDDESITVVRHGNDVWVWDSPQEGIAQRIHLCTQSARTSADHGVVEVFHGLSASRWVELRVELMDHPELVLHDNRADRSFG